MKSFKKFILLFIGCFFSTIYTYQLTVFLNFPNIPYLSGLTDINIIFYLIVIFLYILVITYVIFKIVEFILAQSFKIISDSYINTILVSILINSGFIILIYTINLLKFEYYLANEFRNIILFSIILLILIFMFISLFFKYLIYNKVSKKRALIVLILSFSLLFIILFFSYEKVDNLSLLITNTNKKKDTSIIYFKTNKRIINLYIEGLSFDFIFPLISEGKLPNFNWIMEHGAWGKLKSFSPTHRLSHYTSYLTGVYPSKHHRYSLWVKVLSNDYKYKLFIIPSGFFYFLIEKTGLIKNIFTLPDKEYKKTVLGYLKQHNIKYFKINYFLEEKSLSINTDKKQVPVPFDEIHFSEDKHLLALKKDIILDEERLFQITEALKKNKDYSFFFSYIDGLLDAEQQYYKYSFPEYFPDVSEEEIYKYGTIIEKYYQYLDQYIGKIIINMRENDLLIINSTFGLNPINPIEMVIDKILKRKTKLAVYNNSKEGLIFFFGNGIKENYDISDFKIINAFPLFFYYLGLPLPKESHKNIKINMFKSNFINENPIIFSYDRGKK